MTTKRKLTAVLVLALLLSACGDGDDGPASDGTVDESDVSEAQAEAGEAQQAFCGDAADYLAALDDYGRLFTDDGLTVGQVTDVTATLEPARTQVERAAVELRNAITEVQRLEAMLADPTQPPSTVDLEDGTQQLVDQIDAAQTELDATVADVDADMLLRDAAVEVSSAVFAVEMSWIQLYGAAGCLSPDAAVALTDLVKAVQADLAATGYYSGAIDGVYGPATADAVRGVQADAGLPETGMLDAATQAALAAAVVDTGVDEALHVAALQGVLATTGFYTGPIDGVWSQDVADAVIALQEAASIEPTGTIDLPTLQAMFDALVDAADEAEASDDTDETTTSTSTGAPPSSSASPGASSPSTVTSE